MTAATPMPDDLHSSAILFDGLVVSKWNRHNFENMKKGGLTAANCTICIWENTKEVLLNIATFRRHFEENADLIRPCRTVADIRAAKEEGRVGIVLGWQNSSGVDERIEYLQLFKELGVGFVQLTYNTQNHLATGCLDSSDGGLTQYGETFVKEMNRVGIVVDLSHVGAKSASDVIRFSEKPVAYTHVCPAGLYAHPHNKTDDQLREISGAGGFVGVAAYAPFMRNKADSTLDDVVDLFEHVISICGEDRVGIGTDMTEGQDDEFFRWIRLDKGHGRQNVPGAGVAPMVKGFGSLADYPNLTQAMWRRGWTETRIRKVLGENWLGFLEQVW
jgi:membrane dipeptidase